MTVDEMANQEAQRVETLRLLNYQADVVAACDAINPILKDLERIARESGFLWASLYVFSLGRIYGVRQERARRAKRNVLVELINWGRKVGFRKAMKMCEVRRVPRRLRRAAKLINKMYRGALRLSEGKPVQPIAAKHCRR